jgi:hypothetical protein
MSSCLIDGSSILSIAKLFFLSKMHKFLFYKQSKQNLIFIKNFYNLPNIYIYINVIKKKHFMVEGYVNKLNYFLFNNKYLLIFNFLNFEKLKFFFYSNGFLVNNIKNKNLNFEILKKLLIEKKENLCVFCLIYFPIFCNIITNYNILDFLNIFFFIIDKWTSFFIKKKYFLN